jgi:hypothetical protein
VVAFHEQFQELVGRFGLVPRDDQTQREFAQVVEDNLRARLTSASLERFPGELAELFYRVRFGDGTLDPAEAANVELRMRQLKAILMASG